MLKTPFLKKQIEINYIQTTIPKIGLDRIENLFIPQLPKFSKQKKCLNFYNKAFKKAQIKQKKAEALLANIDNYLLEEIGIQLKKKDFSLKNRIITTSLSKVSGLRFDPFYLTNCINIPSSKKYKEIQINEIAKVKKGQSITSADINKGQYPVIAGGQTSPYLHNEYNYSGNVITISASGAYSGFVWYHSQPIFASDCSVVYSKNEKIANTEFLSNVLKAKQQQLYNLQQGSGQPHVYPSDIKKIKIPLPTLKTQILINKKITYFKNKVNQLKIEAKKILNEAKIEVEKIISHS